MTMPTRLLFLSAFWVTCTFGQNAPVTVVKAIPHFEQHAIFADGHGGMTEDMAVEYRNDSDKEIVEVKFRVFFLNKGDPKTQDWNSVGEYSSKHKLAPGKKNTAQWPSYVPFLAKKMRADVIKIVFKDGSTWERSN
jgi:hypothetical protein